MSQSFGVQMMRFAIVRNATAYYNQVVFVTRRSEEAPRRVSRLMYIAKSAVVWRSWTRL